MSRAGVRVLPTISKSVPSCETGDYEWEMSDALFRPKRFELEGELEWFRVDFFSIGDESMLMGGPIPAKLAQEITGFRTIGLGVKIRIRTTNLSEKGKTLSISVVGDYLPHDISNPFYYEPL